MQARQAPPGWSVLPSAGLKPGGAGAGVAMARARSENHILPRAGRQRPHSVQGARGVPNGIGLLGGAGAGASAVRKGLVEAYQPPAPAPVAQPPQPR